MRITAVEQKHDILFDNDVQNSLKVPLLKRKNLSYEQLIEPVEDRMMKSIWRIVRHPEAAEDTMQEALLIIWKKLDRICSHPNPQALILKICINASYDTLRKGKRHRRHKDQNSLKQISSKTEISASLTIEKRETEEEIHRAISQLPKKQATAVFMRIVEELPYEIIAQALGCKEGTVRIHVSKGRVKLSQYLAHLNPATIRKESK